VDDRRGESNIQRACRQGSGEWPQIIIKNGRTAVVVVSAEEWERKTRGPGNLAEFFAESSLRDSGLKAPRKDSPREIAL
jgi:hypothetical protein